MNKQGISKTEETLSKHNARRVYFEKSCGRESKLLRLALVMVVACVWANCMAGELPSPVLVLKGTEDCEVRGKALTRYLLSISNRTAYPDEMFAPAPDLPPAGKNTNASRTRVEIHDSTGRQLYGFSALKSAASLDNLWFTVARGAKPPDKVYVVLHDRRTNVKLTSNQVETDAGRTGEKPASTKTAASQRANAPVQSAATVPVVPRADGKAPAEPGATQPSAKPDAASVGVIDPASLITQAEAEAVLGCTVVGRARPTTGSISSYEYRRIEHGAMLADNIQIRVGWGKQAVESFRNVKAGQYARTEPVEGLGDDACWVPQWGQLQVLHKGVRLIISVASFSVLPTPGGSDALLKQRLNQSKSLAKKAIERLPH